MEDFNQADGSKDYFRLLEELEPLVRATRNLHGALEQARDVHELINWRDEAYSLVRRVELLQGDAKIALDFEIARQAETQAEASHQMAISAHRLNVLTTFFPLATLSALFGMQFKHGMEDWDNAHQPILIIGVLVAGLLAGSALTLLITRPAKRPQARED